MEAPVTVRRRRIDSGFPGGPRNKTGALPGRSRRETVWESGFPSPACGRFRRGTEGYSLCRSGRSTAADNPFGKGYGFPDFRWFAGKSVRTRRYPVGRAFGQFRPSRFPPRPARREGASPPAYTRHRRGCDHR